MKMRHEIRVFFTALMFYTRIPCPEWVDHSEEYINKSTRYFPLIGWIVGGTAGLILIGGIHFFTVPVAVLFSMSASVLMTGAFHEDGFADVCDGFGGGWTRQKILAIMKDSRVGAYGAIGMILILSTKLFVTIDIAESFRFDLIILVLILVSSHSLSRFIASTFIATHSYVRDNDKSKVKPVAKSLPVASLFTGALFGIIPFTVLLMLTETWVLALSLIPPVLAKMYLGRYFNKWIGGYTGDCLGATQQVTEIIFLVSIAAIWTSI